MMSPRRVSTIAVLAASALALSGLIVWGVGAAAGTAPSPSAPPFAVATTLPGLAAPTGEPQLASIRALHPKPGSLVQASGPFDDRFTLESLAFDGKTATGTVTVTSDVSAVLELEVLVGFYDAEGTLLGTNRFVHHLTDDGNDAEGHPAEDLRFSVAVPTEIVDRASSIGVGVPVLVNE
jgi:hypothetical protein